MSRSLHKVRDAALDWFLPMGYEDETGFHYGEQDERTKAGGTGTSPGGRRDSH